MSVIYADAEDEGQPRSLTVLVVRPDDILWDCKPTTSSELDGRLLDVATTLPENWVAVVAGGELEPLARAAEAAQADRADASEIVQALGRVAWETASTIGSKEPVAFAIRAPELERPLLSLSPHGSVRGPARVHSEARMGIIALLTEPWRSFEDTIPRWNESIAPDLQAELLERDGDPDVAAVNALLAIMKLEPGWALLPPLAYAGLDEMAHFAQLGFMFWEKLGDLYIARLPAGWFGQAGPGRGELSLVDPDHMARVRVFYKSRTTDSGGFMQLVIPPERAT